MQFDTASDAGAQTRSPCGAMVTSSSEALEVAREVIGKAKGMGYRFVVLSMTASTKANVTGTGALSPLVDEGCRVNASWVDSTRVARGDELADIVVVTWGDDPFKIDVAAPSDKPKAKAKPKAKRKPSRPED